MKDELLSRFQHCYDQKQFDAAFDACAEAIHQDAGDWNAIYLAGVTLRSRGDLIPAIDYYERALKLNSDEGPIWQALGIALQLLGRFPEAIEALSTAVRLQPDNDYSQNSLGLTYKLAGHFRLAMLSYLKAVDIREDRAMKKVRHDRPELFRELVENNSKVLFLDDPLKICICLRDILVTEFEYFHIVRNMVACCDEMGDPRRAQELQECVDACVPIDADTMRAYFTSDSDPGRNS